jgi:hypothetical protein
MNFPLSEILLYPKFCTTPLATNKLQTCFWTAASITTTTIRTQHHKFGAYNLCEDGNILGLHEWQEFFDYHILVHTLCNMWLCTADKHCDSCEGADSHSSERVHENSTTVIFPRWVKSPPNTKMDRLNDWQLPYCCLGLAISFWRPLLHLLITFHLEQPEVILFIQILLTFHETLGFIRLYNNPTRNKSILYNRNCM